MVEKENIIAKKLKKIHDCFEPSCPHCTSKNVYGISRIVGYFSIIENWNESKTAELKRRQKGVYWKDDSKDFTETNIQARQNARRTKTKNK
jgi:ribonucleoside-triphosphate reductase